MSKRSYQNLGITLLVLPLLFAVVIQLTTGDVVSTTPPEDIGHGSSGNASYTALIIRFHWTVLLPMLASFIGGVSCIISSRRTR